MSPDPSNKRESNVKIMNMENGSTKVLRST